MSPVLTLLFKIVLYGLLTLNLLFLSACGGGGGGGGSSDITINNEEQTDNNPAAGAAGNGAVSLVVTDAPSEDFDHIYLTITSVALLGNDNSGQVVIFSGEETIDLLALEQFADFFALNDEVPAGTYNKIRLYISAIELIKLDNNGDIEEAFNPSLPANGKIDLNNRGGFVVNDGELLTIELDIDAKHSIHIVGTGNDRYKFRPVIFVNIVGDNDSTKLLRVAGIISSIDYNDLTLVVCSAHSVAAANSDEHDSDNCVDINSSDQLGVFNEAALAIPFADLAVDDPVLITGHYDMDDDINFDITAEIIQRGPVNAASRFTGVTSSDYDDISQQFSFDFANNQGFAPDTSIIVLMADNSAVFDQGGNRLETDAISNDLPVLVEGVVSLSNVDVDTLNAILVIISPDLSEEESLQGDILDIDADERELLISTDIGDRCVQLPLATDIIAITNEDGLESEMLTINELLINDEVDVFGEEDENNGCFVATTVVVDRTDDS